ncbi:MAG: C45 family autoproteolytic acyltransferase/hydrolase [Candidatus Omnitrophica bacterium]|nr:C45 family autoproteolytic acyltransferase/hydrolase [Candidatus Omnitrophota bacterium]
MIKKYLLSKALFLFVFSILFAPSVIAKVKIVAREGSGVLLEQDGQKILLLKGSPYEIGYQHGKLLKNEIKKLSEIILSISFSVNPDWLMQAWERSKKYIPERYIQEIEGLSAGSEIPVEKLFLANIFPEIAHCSGIYLGKNVTKNKEIFHVRILDYITEGCLQDFAVVMIIRPDKYNAFITAGFAGFVGSVTGMNDKKISVGEMGGGGYGSWDGMPMTFLLRKVLEESNTLSEAVRIFQNTPRTCEYYYLITDAKIPDARGVYATADKFEILTPGQNHYKLPAPFPENTILMTGPDRYPVLRERIQKKYGLIDLNSLIEIIKRPVSMSGNLHNAIFLPEKLIMYLAVADKPYKENFQACYQKYHQYDMKKLMRYYPLFSKKIIYKPPFRLKADTENQKIEGILPAEKIRQFNPNNYEQLTQYLEIYNVEKKDIPYTLTLKYAAADCDIYQLTFPSLITTQFPQLNTVYGEYYKNRKNSDTQCIILLDVQNGKLVIPRIMAYKLACQGINSLVLELPVFATVKRTIDKKNLNIQNIPLIINQAVNDIRVASSIMSTFKENSKGINLCGTSFGAIAGALAAGIDGNYDKVCLVMGSGGLYDIATNHKDFSTAFSKSLPESLVKSLLVPFDPLTYVERLSSTRILMINAENDEIIPKSSVLNFYEKLKDKDIIWYPGTHYELRLYICDVIKNVENFFLNKGQ